MQESPAKLMTAQSHMCTMTPTRNGGSPFSEPASTPAHAVITECMCPSCQYYRAAMLYHHDCASPMVDQFQHYQSPHQTFGSFSPQQQLGAAAVSMPMAAVQQMGQQRMGGVQQQLMSASVSGGRSPLSTRSPSPPMTELLPEGAAARNVDAQFEQAVGALVQTACTAAGRSLLQQVIRLQQADRIRCIYDEVLADFETVALDTHGCHVLRSLLEVVDGNQVVEMVSSLDENLILNLATVSQYTRRVLQTLFEKHPEQDFQAVVDVLGRNSRYLAATQQGCIALMRVYERCPPQQQQTLVQGLLPVFAELACDPFGNYVVQCVFDNAAQASAVLYAAEFLTGRFLRMSCNKFGSNVVEKVIRFSTPELRRALLNELIFDPTALQQLVHDGYGNFVIQALLTSAPTPAEHRSICDRLRPLTASSPYGHKIEAKMRRRFGPNTNDAVRRASMPSALTQLV